MSRREIPIEGRWWGWRGRAVMVLYTWTWWFTFTVAASVPDHIHVPGGAL